MINARRITGFILTLLPSAAFACDEDSLPVRYLKAIQAMNWDEQGSMLAEDARYYDPTMIFYDRPAIDLRGPEAIVSFWRSSSEVSGTESIQYTMTGCFETAGYYVMDYDIEIKVSGAFWQVNKDVITVPGQVTSVIRTDADEVIEHIDYVDYAGGERHVETLRKHYGATESSSNE